MMKGPRKVEKSSQPLVQAGSLILICGTLSLAGVRMVVAQTGLGSGIGGQPSSHQSANGTASNGSPSLLDPGTSPFPDNSRQKRNDERQRRLVSDTQKLVILTAQLKDEVATSGVDKMTPEMLKQMDEIEKLAKSVKDKMRD